MKFIQWIAEQINTFKHLVPKEDLFYENLCDEDTTALQLAIRSEKHFIKAGKIVSKQHLLQ